MKIKSIRAIAIINKKRKRLDVRDIYDVKDNVKINKDEIAIKVIIKQYKPNDL